MLFFACLQLDKINAEKPLEEMTVCLVPIRMVGVEAREQVSREIPSLEIHNSATSSTLGMSVLVVNRGLSSQHIDTVGKKVDFLGTLP